MVMSKSQFILYDLRLPICIEFFFLDFFFIFCEHQESGIHDSIMKRQNIFIDKESVTNECFKNRNLCFDSEVS